MQKIYLFLAALILFFSCYDGNPLDPAKGIDSQGETTLFTGIVTDTSSNPLPGASVTCYKCNYSGVCDVELWTTTTDSTGFYVKRYDLSDLYNDIQLSSGSQDIKIYASQPDYDSDRQSHFDPVIYQDFSY